MTKKMEGEEAITFTRFCPILNLVITVEGWLAEWEKKTYELIEKKDKGEDITKEIIYS